MRNSNSVRIFDFSGGLKSNTSAVSIDIDSASDLQNINILPEGSFSARLGNTVFNSTAMVSGSTPISGLGYFRKSDLTDALVSVAGTKFFTSASLSGTMTDSTGAITITSGQNKLWTFTPMNDFIIGVGGAPDAPFTWNGTGNAGALGGSPPSGNFGIQGNNYMFIGNTTANPSRIAWSIFGNPADWSGTGSGNQDVSKNDGDTLVGASVMSNDQMLLFKQNSIHSLIIRNPPFPIFPLFRGAGAVSKRGIVNADGIVYFITPQPRMKATDGNQIVDFPDTIDDVWDGLSQAQLANLHGIYNPVKRQIWWFVSNGSSTTHNLCIVWDLVRKCWLRHTTGYGMNASVRAKDYLIYGGAYDGKCYKQDAATTYSDASESSPGSINSYWRSGWIDFRRMINSKTIPYIDVSFLSKSTGTFDISYGFDFLPDRSIVSVSLLAPGNKWNQFLWGIGRWGGQSNTNKTIFTKGSGKFVQFFIRHNSATEGFTFNGMEVPVKQGQSSIIKTA